MADKTVLVKRPVIKTDIPAAPKETESCGCGVQDDYGVLQIYSPYMAISTAFTNLTALIIAILIMIVLINLFFCAFMGFILLILPKTYKCPKCGHTFKSKNKNITRCPKCGELLEKEIRAH